MYCSAKVRFFGCRKKKVVRKIIAIVITLAVIGGIAFGMYSLFKEPEEAEKEIMPGFVYRGSIQSMVTGSGSAKPTDSTTINIYINVKLCTSFS